MRRTFCRKATPYFLGVSWLTRMKDLLGDVAPKGVSARMIGAKLELTGPKDDLECIGGHIQELAPFELSEEVFLSNMEKAKNE